MYEKNIHLYDQVNHYGQPRTANFNVRKEEDQITLTVIKGVYPLFENVAGVLLEEGLLPEDVAARVDLEEHPTGALTLWVNLQTVELTDNAEVLRYVKREKIHITSTGKLQKNCTFSDRAFSAALGHLVYEGFVNPEDVLATHYKAADTHLEGKDHFNMTEIFGRRI